MTKIKGFCLKCHQERVIIIDCTIKTREEIKYIGHCEKCRGYICRIISRESPEAS